jgi:hypothetical protein
MARVRDNLVGVVACLGAAVVLAPLFWWLVQGAVGAGADVERFDGRTQRDVGMAGVIVLGFAVVVGVAILGLVGLGVWMIVKGVRGRGEGGAHGD